MIASNFGLSDGIAFIGVGGNGKIVIAGYTYDEPLHPYYGYTNYFAIAVFNEDGTRDLTFSNAGLRFDSSGPDSRIHYTGMLVLPTNQIVFQAFYAGPGGSATNVYILMDGLMNPLFSAPYLFPTTVAAYNNGKLIIGASPGQVELRAINPDGTSDTKFGFLGTSKTRIAAGIRNLAQGRRMKMLC